MLVSLALSLIAIASGTLLTYAYDEDAPLASRLCAGACIGFGSLGLVGFILASLIGLNALSLAFTGVILMMPLLLLRNRKVLSDLNADINGALRAISKATSRPDLWAFIYFLFYAVVIIVMWRVFDRAMLVKPEGISTGVLNNFGDLPFHLSAITRFAYGQNYPPEDPTFSGVRFTYPFMTDFISAMFVRAGASLRDSMFIENVIISVALVGVLHRFGQQLLRDRTAALLTPVLIILNGGFGWFLFLRDASNAGGGVFEVLKTMPHSYTILPDVAQGWRWGNAVTSLLLTQRGFLLGIPLAAIVFGQWWLSLRSSDQDSKKETDEGKRKKEKGENDEVTTPASKDFATRDDSSRAPGLSVSSLFPSSFFLLPSSKRMIAAGAVAGLLPLVHAHSFIAVMGVGGCLALINWKRWRDWILFFAVASAIAVPQLLWSTHHSAVSTTNFIGFEFGWGHGTDNILWFWLKNTGLFIPLLIAALIWKRDEYLVTRRLMLFYLPFTLCFIVPNIVRLAPWIWDNVKILFYWWIGSAPLVALLLARLWQGKTWNRVLAAALLVVLTAAGALDVYALAAGRDDYGEFDRDGVAFAEKIREQTAPRAMILHAPIHNTPIFLTGRRSLMGYPGHIWTHGIAFGEREAEIKRIYAGALDAPYLLAKYQVDYVAVGPTEKAALKVNEEFFKRYRKVIEVGGYSLYQVSP